MQRKGHMKTSEGSHLQVKEKVPQKKVTLLTPRFWTSSLWNCQKINFCCFNQSVVFCYGNSSKLTQILCTKQKQTSKKTKTKQQITDRNGKKRSIHTHTHTLLKIK